jgi:hypothetical protein
MARQGKQMKFFCGKKIKSKNTHTYMDVIIIYGQILGESIEEYLNT